VLRGDLEQKPQISPLRYAPVEMTILFVMQGSISRVTGKTEVHPTTELSSRAAHSRRRVEKGMTRLLCTGNLGFGCPILRPFLA
jgi:hypothetical protein